VQAVLRSVGLAVAVVLVTAAAACSPAASDDEPTGTPTASATTPSTTRSDDPVTTPPDESGAGGTTPGVTGSEATVVPSPTTSASPPTRAATAPDVEVAGIGSANVITLPLDDWDVRVDWPQDPDGTDLGEYLVDHPDVAVLTNAGIFSTDLAPGGLLVADGRELRALNLADGAGNFHLKPNAVFAILDDGTAEVVDATAYDPTGVVQATQSGPALVLDGVVHPEFREGSENVAIRSGVGVSRDGRTVHLAISFAPMNLWDFATLFRDELEVDDALYLDGQISQVWIDGVTDEPLAFLGPYAGVIAASRR